MFRRYLPAMVEDLATDRHDSLPGMLTSDTASRHRPTAELTHAGTNDAAREAELSAPSGAVCSELARHV